MKVYKMMSMDTFESPVNPSFTFGIIKMWVGAWGDMSLNARTCQKNIQMNLKTFCFKDFTQCTFAPFDT